MTEQEAKTKWCPHVRYYNGAMNAPAYNRASTRKFKCIASECMMWEWVDSRTEDAFGDAMKPEGSCGLINNI